HALVGAFVPRLLLDLLDRITLVEVDRDGSDLPRLGQALRDAIDDEHAGCAPQQRRVGRHEAYRTAPIDRYGLAGRDAGELTAVVAGGEDVGQQGEVRLVLGSRRQLQAVEVGVGDSDAFGLPTHVRTHGDIPVGAAG